MAKMKGEDESAYEKGRAENIKKNYQRMADLKLPELAAKNAPPKQLRRPRPTRGINLKRERKPVVARRSLRVKGMNPDGVMLEGIAKETRDGIVFASDKLGLGSFREEKPSRLMGPVTFESLNEDKELNQKLFGSLNGGLGTAYKPETSVEDLADVHLEEEHVLKLTRSGITHLDTAPRTDNVAIAAGDKDGHVGFWCPSNVSEDSEVVVEVRPHSQYVSGLRWCPMGSGALYTCSYDGSVRKLDIKQQTFLELFSSEEYELSAFDVTHPHKVLLCDNLGNFMSIDTRVSSKKPVLDAIGLHNRKINTIHADPGGSDLIVTSSSDAAVAVWDLRRMGPKNAISTYHHPKSCQAAFFAPDGSQRMLATCYDNHLNVWDTKKRPVPFQPEVKVNHDTQTGRWVIPFRAIWTPNSDGIVCGTMKRAVNIYSAANGQRLVQKSSEYMTAIASRYCVHPTLSKLVVATSSGRIHLYQR